MAIESPRVTADVIETSEFPDLIRRYAVRGVPKIVINDRAEFMGALPEPDYLAQVMAAAGVDAAFKNETQD